MKCWSNWPSVMLTLVPFNPRLQWTCTAAAWYPSYTITWEMKCTILWPSTSNMTDGCWWIEWTDALKCNIAGISLMMHIFSSNRAPKRRHMGVKHLLIISLLHSMEWMTGSPSKKPQCEIRHTCTCQHTTHSHVSSHSLDRNSIPINYNAGTAICITCP